MTVALANPPGRSDQGCASDSYIAWLAGAILRKRFMPAPPPDNIFVGDGDYRCVGAEFLCHFVNLADLAPDSRVLDIGCGIGRMAVPLTQYLDPDHGSYEGVDPVAGGIDWCARVITPAYPNFRFRHLDIRHRLYNPDGAIDGAAVVLPFEAASFDLILMVSVVTHLPAPEVEAYAREVSRLLKPGGRCFLTAFVMDEAAASKRDGGDARLGFVRVLGGGPEWHVDQASPLSAVAFDDGFVEAKLEEAGLVLRSKRLGHWRGGAAEHYQDFFIAERRREAAE
jgi:SAM-dependent methyltransferase